MPTSPRRRPSRTASRRSKILPSLPSRTRPGLAVDTSVSRHRAPAPQQVFPAEAKTQELSFISLADIKALKKQRSINKTRQRELASVQRQASQRAYPAHPAKIAEDADVPPPYSRNKTSDDTQAVHKRIKGLRPTPLDLATDISPSDRAITIGISVDPKTASMHSRTPSSPVGTQNLSTSNIHRIPSEQRHGQEVVTPTIVITPAKEDFDFGLEKSASPEDVQSKAHRPTSSIYSRYTNCMPANGYTPPVPPLPLFAVGKTSRVREADNGGKENGHLKMPKRGGEKNLSVCTVFEEDQPTPQDPKRLTSQSHLPTPRRSRGWWNLITSPFSASSRSNAFFWRSPSADEDGDRSRMLDDTLAHAGLIFTNRSLEDLDLRSAPPVDSRPSSFSATKPRQPKRSDTAPGALDPHGEIGVDIYAIPYVGEAASYYNPHKNFPSVYVSAGADGVDRGLHGWSPSQSVYREPRGSVKAVVAHVDDVDASDTNTDGANPFDDPNGASRALDDEKSPFSDKHASTAFQDFSGTHPAATAERKFFSTPETEELRGASPEQPGRPGPTRNDTVESHFSPLTATPVIESAQMGTLMGPSVVDVRATPSRQESPRASGIGVATMASRGVDDDRAMPENRPWQHQRNDSYGLGIDTDDESVSEKSLFPPPKPLAHQPRLGTDRFGQLRIEKEIDRGFDRPPWYRRFLWWLVGVAAALLLLFVILLVLFIPQRHEDMAVQAQWLNLTGFPAMPIGVATVVQPKTIHDESGCVEPEGLWSCGVPSGMHDGDDEVPNFRFEIRFRNKTGEDMNATGLTPLTYKRTVGGASQAGAMIKRSAFTDSLFASLPAPPSKEDMVFLGNTTDDVSEPFEGEETPFYISLRSASALVEEISGSKSFRLVRREKGAGVYPYPTSDVDSSDGSESDESSTSDAEKDSDDKSNEKVGTAAPSDIPRPILGPDGLPALAQLYPLAHAQPVRLFNRGDDSEHYGFYTYFDRSVYIRTSNRNGSADSTNSNGTISGDILSDTALEDSNAVCVFSQTRLHVQIWTRKGTIGGSINGTISSSDLPAAANSTANDMSKPGSFPYPVTVTLDRHGGKADQKGAYCYGLDSEGRVQDNAKAWVAEDRGFDGTQVNAAEVPGVKIRSGLSPRDNGGSEEGNGIDGGDGGCKCAWKS